MEPEYLIWSNEHSAWLAPDCRGYCSIISQAGRYDLQQAQKICEQANVARDGMELHEVIVMAPEHAPISAGPSDDVIITRRQLCELWGVGFNTVLRMEQRNELPVIRLSPRRLGFRMGAIRQLMARREAGAAAEDGGE